MDTKFDDSKLNLSRRSFVKAAAGTVAGAAAAGMIAGCSNQAEPEGADGKTEAADLVLTGGTIQTMVESETAEAVAVKGGEIVYVGDAEGAKPLIDDAVTKVIDLEGKFVAPGFIDSHTHDVQALMVSMFQCYLTETEPTVAAYQAAVKAYADANPDVDVIRGGSIDLKAFENGIPTAAWIDEVVSDRPVMLSDMSLHGACLNTKAIEVCGVTKDTPDPDGGLVYRDAEGNPTGYFSDASSLLGPLGEATYTADQYEEAFKVYQTHANELGITSIQLGGNEIAAEDQWGVHKKLEAAGELTLRVGDTIWAEGFSDGGYTAESAARDIALLDANKDKNSDFVHLGMLKMKFDGVPEGASSYLLEPYAPGANMAADYHGSLNGDATAIQDYVTAANKAGYQVQVHAMGDASVKVALDAFQHAQDENGDGDYRNVITHVNLITDEDKKRMGELKVIANMQPLWFPIDPQFSALEQQNLGEERFDSEYHIKDMVDAGIVICGSADYPITADDVVPAIEAAVTQQMPMPDGEDDPATLRHADQTVDVMEALRMYTTNGAFEMRMEDKIGTIEVGKKADLVVLSDDIATCDANKIADATVVYTISDGRIVFEA